MQAYHFYYYLTLLIAIGIVVSTFLKTRNWVSFSILFPAFYILYSFIAPLGIILGEESLFYQPLHYKLFCLMDDWPLYKTHTYLCIFLIAWYIGYFFRQRKIKSDLKRSIIVKNYKITTAFLMIVATIFCCIFIFANSWVFDLATITSGKSLYVAYNFDLTPSTIIRATHGLWGAIIIGLGAMVLCAMPKKHRLTFLFFVIHVLAYTIISFLIGDRGQLFVVLIALTVIYHIAFRQINFRFLLPTGMAFVIISTIIKNLRGLNSFDVLMNPSLALKIFNFDSFFRTVFSSAENIAAYLSVYFCANNDIPFVYGKSFVYLLLSFIPRLVLPERPGSFAYHIFYVHEARLEGIGQGFTFHQVADWYINFGIVGIFCGGIFLGWCLRKIEALVYEKKCVSLFNLTIFATLCGWLPQLIRTGIEGYKAFLYEYVLVLFIVMLVLPRIAIGATGVKRIDTERKRFVEKEYDSKNR